MPRKPHIEYTGVIHPVITSDIRTQKIPDDTSAFLKNFAASVREQQRVSTPVPVS
jgi:hypothetical protein